MQTIRTLFIDLDEEQQHICHKKIQSLVCILIWKKDPQYWQEKEEKSNNKKT